MIILKKDADSVQERPAFLRIHRLGVLGLSV